MALSDTNMRLNPESLVPMNYIIVTSVKNSSWEVPGSLRWKLVVLGGFGRNSDFRGKSEFAPASQIPAKIPANFPGQAKIQPKSQPIFPGPAKIQPKIPANFPSGQPDSAKSLPISPGQPKSQPISPVSQNPSQFAGQPESKMAMGARKILILNFLDVQAFFIG